MFSVPGTLPFPDQLVYGKLTPCKLRNQSQSPIQSPLVPSGRLRVQRQLRPSLPASIVSLHAHLRPVGTATCMTCMHGKRAIKMYEKFELLKPSCRICKRTCLDKLVAQQSHKIPEDSQDAKLTPNPSKQLFDVFRALGKTCKHSANHRPPSQHKSNFCTALHSLH